MKTCVKLGRGRAQEFSAAGHPTEKKRSWNGQPIEPTTQRRKCNTQSPAPRWQSTRTDGSWFGFEQLPHERFPHGAKQRAPGTAATTACVNILVHIHRHWKGNLREKFQIFEARMRGRMEDGARSVEKQKTKG